MILSVLSNQYSSMLYFHKRNNLRYQHSWLLEEGRNTSFTYFHNLVLLSIYYYTYLLLCSHIRWNWMTRLIRFPLHFCHRIQYDSEQAISSCLMHLSFPYCALLKKNTICGAKKVRMVFYSCLFGGRKNAAKNCSKNLVSMSLSTRSSCITILPLSISAQLSSDVLKQNI